MSVLAAVYGEEDIEITGISDIDPSAPAAALAAERGIFFTTDFHELLDRSNINFIINATDDRDVSMELEAAGKKGISVIDGNVASFLLDILEKLKRDKAHLQHDIERQSILYNSPEQSKEHLTKIINTSADMIMVTDRDGYITECNYAGENMLGYKRTELIGTRASEYWGSPEERRRVVERLSQEGKITNYETRLRRKDGRYIDISLSIAVLMDDSGNMSGTVGISKDITEKKRYEEDLRLLNEKLEDKVIERTGELEAANRELEKSNKLKSQFIANMSHELRTPLNSIIGFSETLLELPVGNLNEKQERYIHRIYSSGKHLLHLINNLLDLAKIEAGRFSLVYEEFRLSSVIEDAVSVVEPLAKKKELSVSYKVDEAIGTVTADKVKFKQILYNLLSNAVKFTPERGAISLDAGLLTGQECEAYGINSSQKLMRISVKDTGIGISPEDMDKIFDEFEQADSSFTRRHEGTGIGLSLTKKLVEMHGGLIWAESAAGEGSTFSFIIPVLHEVPAIAGTKEKESKAVFPGEATPDADHKNVILIVEDDLATSELLTTHLSEAGYHVAHAYNGAEAIKKATMIKPFAIILDIMLPEKDGWEVLQEIRSQSETKDIPVVIYSVIDNRELGFALGATDYITKPIDRNTLLSRLKELGLSKQKLQRVINIMVVDDNPDAVELIASMLEPEGFKVVRAYSGSDALRMVEEIKIDMIFLDLMMPDMDGFEVIQRLKDVPSTRDIPIFIVTAKDITYEDRLLLAGQIEKIYQKSQFTKDDFVEQIKTLEILYPVKAGLIDSTSRLFNQAYFQLRLAQEIKRAERYREPLSLVVIDIAALNKYINDIGSYYGDIIVKKIAEILRKGLRGSDVITRLGTDKFAVILTKTLKQPAAIIGRRFKSIIEGYPFYGIENFPEGKLTASVAVASYPEDAVKPEELIYKVANALRAARDEGGDKVVVL